MYDFSKIDVARGFDVVRADDKVVQHFDTYDEAWDYASAQRGLAVRYYAVWVEPEA